MPQPEPPAVPALEPLVLVAVGDADSREVYARGLRGDGLRVAFAGDGRQALDLTLALVPDLLIVETALPGLAGAVVCRRVKAEPRTRGITTLMLAAPADASSAGKSGVDEMLPQPCPPDDLLVVVRRLLSRRRRRQHWRESVQATRPAGRALTAPMIEAARRRACPACGGRLEWIETRVLDGRWFDYYQWCRNGCGLFCYDLGAGAFEKLIN